MGHVIGFDMKLKRWKYTMVNSYRWRCSCGAEGEWLEGLRGKNQTRLLLREHEAEMRRAERVA